MSAPTDEAWGYFMAHHADIRACCEQFLPRPHIDVPNTRIGIVNSATGEETITEERAKWRFPRRHKLAEFDAAVAAKDSAKLTGIMNDAWLRAPESRSVYRIPGFSEMCNLLDCTVDGFVEVPAYEDEAP